MNHTFRPRSFSFDESQAALVVDALDALKSELQHDLQEAEDSEDVEYLRQAMDKIQRLLVDFENA